MKAALQEAFRPERRAAVLKGIFSFGRHEPPSPRLPFEERWQAASYLSTDLKRTFALGEVTYLALQSAGLSKIPKLSNVTQGKNISPTVLAESQLPPEVKEPLLAYFHHRAINQDRIIQETSQGDIPWGKPEVGFLLHVNGSWNYPYSPDGIYIKVGNEYPLTGRFEGLEISAAIIADVSTDRTIELRESSGVPIFQAEDPKQIRKALETVDDWLTMKELIRLAETIMTPRVASAD